MCSASAEPRRQVLDLEDMAAAVLAPSRPKRQRRRRGTEAAYCQIIAGAPTPTDPGCHIAGDIAPLKVAIEKHVQTLENDNRVSCAFYGRISKRSPICWWARTLDRDGLVITWAIRGRIALTYPRRWDPSISLTSSPVRMPADACDLRLRMRDDSGAVVRDAVFQQFTRKLRVMGLPWQMRSLIGYDAASVCWYGLYLGQHTQTVNGIAPGVPLLAEGWVIGDELVFTRWQRAPWDVILKHPSTVVQDWLTREFQLRYPRTKRFRVYPHGEATWAVRTSRCTYLATAKGFRRVGKP